MPLAGYGVIGAAYHYEDYFSLRLLGRKNWLFSDTDKGNDRNAKCYSIIESAKANNINVFEFLTPILTELSKYENKPTNEQIEQFLP